MAEYDDIAEKYTAYKLNSVFCENVEYYTFIHRLLLPALEVKDMASIDLNKVLVDYRVLDVACGGGFITSKHVSNSDSNTYSSTFCVLYVEGKLVEQLGCQDAVGVDISVNMINIARRSEDANPLGIIYQVSDVTKLSKPEKPFDIVVAFYLLNYAKTVDELEQMIKSIGGQLKDNEKAHFLSITLNVHDIEKFITSNPYENLNYRCEAERPLVDGSPIKNTHINPDGSTFVYTTYYFSPNIYERAFQKAGFKHFEWVPVTVACDTDQYQEFLKCPAIIGISAHK